MVVLVHTLARSPSIAYLVSLKTREDNGVLVDTILVMFANTDTYYNMWRRLERRATGVLVDVPNHNTPL